MSHELICSVLGVPAEPWPPDHYTLIGLDPGQADPAAVEARVQHLSVRLRAYQLAHPEDVSEVLNRLAQALNCLTDPSARRVYDLARLGTIALAPSPPLVRVYPPRTPNAVEPLDGAPPSGHRLSYRRIVALRRLRLAWLELGRLFGEPEARPTELLNCVDLIQSARSVRTAWARDPTAPIGREHTPGGTVIGLIRGSRILRRYQRLKPSEREAAASDWRNGLVAIDRELSRWRERAGRRHPLARRLRRTMRFLINDGLDISLCLLGLVALGIAIWRS
jgi:hypothetical protein